MKKMIIATIVAGSISSHAFAENGSDLIDANLVFSVDESQSMELAILSPKEMKSTEGAWAPYLIGGGIGFVTGNYTYLVDSAFNDNSTWSWSSYARTVGTATAVGAVSPVSSISGAARAVGTSFISAWQFR